MVNIKDIAKYCNVGVATVSRVLNNQPNVAQKTKKTVLDAVERFNYIPNNSARNLVMTKSNSIGVIVRGRANPFFATMLNVLEETLAKKGYVMILHHIDADEDEILEALILAKEKNLAGILFLGGKFNYTKTQIQALNIPFVQTTYTNKFGTLTKKEYSGVAIDDEAEAYKAVKYLHGLGHRKIAVITPSTNDKSVSELRLTGYKKALSDFGIPYNKNLVQVCKNYELLQAYNASKALLKKNIEFTAVFAVSDLIAIGAMKGFTEAKIKIPQDVSIIGFDGLEISSYVTPTLTTLKQPEKEMSKEAVKILINLIKGEGENKQIIFNTSLVEGKSCKKIN